MTHVRLKDVNVSIPIYDSHALRLIRLPSFSDVRVGSDTASRTNGVIIIHALKNLSFDLAEGDRVCLAAPDRRFQGRRIQGDTALDHDDCGN